MQVFEGYRKDLERVHAVDFDDILLRGLQLFEEQGDVFLSNLRREFNYFSSLKIWLTSMKLLTLSDTLIDEFQDLNVCRRALFARQGVR